jgi:hypothetical protein
MRFLVGALLLACVASPSMATVFNSGTVSAGASVTIGGVTDSFSTGPSSTVVPGTIGSLSFGVKSDDAGNFVNASHRVQATWASADAGTIDIQWGWQSAVSGVSSAVDTNLTRADWTYNFTATGNGTFSGNYRVTGQGNNTFGLQPIYGDEDVPFGPYGGDVFDPTGSGSFSIGLVSGQTYNMRFRNNGNVSSGNGYTADGSARAIIDWKIAYNNVGGVPEPTSWAMLITGFGLVGATARRRRAVAA